jgi:hypothetical protein
MSRADDIRAKARRVSVPAEAAPVAVAVPVVRANPVRMTVDLAPDLHARFSQWCAETAPELGRASLPGVEVVRKLLGRLLADEDLRRSVVEDLRRDAPVGKRPRGK